MGCQSCAQTYLNILNALLLVFSIIILGYAAYLGKELEDFQEAFDEGAIVTPIVFGSFMFVVSVVGICAVYFYSKILLIVYLVLASIVTLAVLVSGSIVLTFSGLLDNLEDERVEQGAGTVEANTVDFVLGVYDKCCVQPFDLAEVVACNATEVTNCISDRENFEEFSLNTPEDACEFLETVEINDVPIVGNPAEITGACGGGNQAVFVDNLTGFIADNLEPLGIICVVLSVLMFMDLCTTCVLLWTSKNTHAEEDEEIKKNEQAGADLAEGGEVKY